MEVLNEGKRPKIWENFKNTLLSNQEGFQKKTIAEETKKVDRTSVENEK